MRVLLVEDEVRLAAAVRRGLVAHGMSVDVAADGRSALWSAGATAYDVVVLDLLLPDLSGLEVCRTLREDGVEAPVLMLTALGTVGDRVAGLDAGADDYLVKPFDFRELLARLRALARRRAGTRHPQLRVADLVLDPATREVWRARQPISLTPKEFALLEQLMRRPGEVLTRFELLEGAWDHTYENRSNVIDVYIGYLRQKVDRPFGRRSIETVPGVGYRLADAGASSPPEDPS